MSCFQYFPMQRNKVYLTLKDFNIFWIIYSITIRIIAQMLSNILSDFNTVNKTSQGTKYILWFDHGKVKKKVPQCHTNTGEGKIF